MILIVEDSRELAKLLSDYLHQAGFATHVLQDGGNVVEWVRAHDPELILLDLMLPGRDGIDICEDLRSFCQIPIIMITARIEEQDRLQGLDAGADDYICKPFSPREVVARVKAVLRRTTAHAQERQVVQLDENRLLATINGQPLSLTVVEFHLLALLASQPGRVFSRTQMIEQIYPDQRVVSDRTIDSHIKKLRKKINEVHQTDLIHSVYSAGYKFEL